MILFLFTHNVCSIGNLGILDWEVILFESKIKVSKFLKFDKPDKSLFEKI